MDDSQLLRYSRHILIDDIGIEGQTRLLASKVLVLGAGGLGSIAAMYLAAAGVGELTITDFDSVDQSNLQRQIAHGTSRVGMNKAISAALTLAELNPEVRVNIVAEKMAGARLAERVANVDIVVDCCDNFSTRYDVNRACVSHRKPLVSGAAVLFGGQVSVYDATDSDSPCYACVFPESSTHETIRCALMGVFAPLVGIIGSMQAAETIRRILGLDGGLVGRLLMLDSRTMEWTEVRTRRVPACPVCSMRTATDLAPDRRRP